MKPKYERESNRSQELTTTHLIIKSLEPIKPIHKSHLINTRLQLATPRVVKIHV